MQQTSISKKERNWKNRQGNERRSDLSHLQYGKIPPQNKDMEMAILGACMLEKQGMDMIIEILRPDCFYVDAHKTIFQCMLNLAAEFKPLDLLTVVERLRQEGNLELIGGPYYVTTLTNSVVSSANIEAHARIVLQKYIQRELIRIGGEIVQNAFEDTTDVFDCLDNAERGLFNITTGHLKKDFTVMESSFNKAMVELKQRMETKEDITGVPSGFSSLDRVTYGWQDTDLIVIAARPSVGKTAFALNLARNAAMNEKKPTKVAIFSLEMSTGQITNRIISAESGKPLDSIARGKITEWELSDISLKCGIPRLLKSIFIDDTPALNLFELRAKCRRLVQGLGVGLIIIDYLQLMSGNVDGKTGNREQEISTISRGLKALAKELHVPIIALSQLSRDVEKRKDGKGPQLSDLRESGAIEQDADMVMFLSRPDYQLESSEVDPTLRGKVDAKIAKHRNGNLATIPLESDLSTQKFIDPNTGNDSNRADHFISKHIAEIRSIETPQEPVDDDDPELPF